MIEKDFTPIIKRINPHYLFYDYELCDLFNSIKVLYDVFKRAKKRFDRKDTLQVSKSVSDFLQLEKDAELYPYVLYDFKCHSLRVCICQFHKKYYVYTCVPNSKAIYQKYQKEWVTNDLYGGYDRLKDTVSLFVSIVNFVCVNSQSVELPF